MSWHRQTAEGVEITVRVVPRASRNAVADVMGDALKIRLQAPPVEGKANRALVKFLAKALGTPERNIEILTGDASRHKRLLIRGITPDEVARLEAQA